MTKRYGSRWLSWDRFIRDFEPYVQSLTNLSWGGFAIKDFRDRWASECVPAIDERRLWSCLINDDHWCVAPGNHIVNRDAVILCRNPYPPEVEDLYVPY